MRFGSKKVIDKKTGITWDSTTEYKYSLVINELKKNNKIYNLDRQVEHILIPSFKDSMGNSIRKMSYLSDFEYDDLETGKHVILDVKGSDFNIDPVFKIKWKLLKQQLQDNKNIQFKLIIKYKDVWYDLENKEEKKKYKEVYSKRKKKTK